METFILSFRKARKLLIPRFELVAFDNVLFGFFLCSTYATIESYPLHREGTALTIKAAGAVFWNPPKGSTFILSSH